MRPGCLSSRNGVSWGLCLTSHFLRASTRRRQSSDEFHSGQGVPWPSCMAVKQDPLASLAKDQAPETGASESGSKAVAFFPRRLLLPREVLFHFRRLWSVSLWLPPALAYVLFWLTCCFWLATDFTLF